ncbi:MAG: coproporphyrinogen III oxidase family protein [Epsilonproteobacteria bacterium]|nr:coproporphyrinogen III oxidase family protein [Campylobacterota bacterium]
MQIYIHIPFCDSKCFYCSFNSYTNLENRIKDYSISLLKSLKYELKNVKKIDSIYIGGGTPSAVSPFYYKEIFELLSPFIDKKIEITIEANPNSATKDWLLQMRELGVNRVSFGVQSFNDKKLKALNRAHSSKEAIRAVELANRVGFKNISLDLIYDFYLDSKELLKKDIEIAFSLPINHISAYELIIERGTNFFSTPEVKANKESFNFFIRDEIIKRGFSWYEVSNYGKYKSSHNLGYWSYKNYIGVGAGAVGFIDNKRFYPHTNIEKYIKEPLFKRVEELRYEDILTEKIFLGLRSIVGVKKEILPSSMQKRADILVDEKRLEFKDGSYFNKDFFISDELALFIMQN